MKPKLLAMLDALCLQYEPEALDFKKQKAEAELAIMKSSHLVGMTTTTAARLQTMLQQLNPQVVIVEEAAEVLEAHVIASVPKSCKQLILIGDHKQLRPSTASHRLARDYHLDVSLFERLVNNGYPSHSLVAQRRMRPEIARLVTPSIYPQLRNHPSVEQFPPVKGVDKSLFFIKSKSREESWGTSYQNMTEADFLLALCQYLLKQGYGPNDITILTTYSGQLAYMNKVQNKTTSVLQKVKITTVDSFQGEENRIILLSLVRSNAEARVGFLQLENRVCVALSRAQEGFYIIGNLDCLCNGAAAVWEPVRKALSEQGAVGDRLPLRCQMHPDTVTHVATADDFAAVPDGGCSRKCDQPRQCLHPCYSHCHPTEDWLPKCKDPCMRVPKGCSKGHTCPHLCCETCVVCKEPIPCLLPCGHWGSTLCGNYNITLPCTKKCSQKMPCGHPCPERCHPVVATVHEQYECRAQCSRLVRDCPDGHRCLGLCCEPCPPCQELTSKPLPQCGHMVPSCCSEPLPSVLRCKRQCNRLLPCGHPCPHSCSVPCGGCKTKVPQLLACGHVGEVLCGQSVSEAECRQRCGRLLLCGHPCSALCGQTCITRCLVPVPSPTAAACGHPAPVPCWAVSSGDVEQSKGMRPGSCLELCRSQLECGHECEGTCGSCSQGRLHIACTQPCSRTLICGHRCTRQCSEPCSQCLESCLMSCSHTDCLKQCWEPCTPCKEPCGRRCPHLACSKLCSEPCDQPPCEQPCAEKLGCGHPCAGFCGDPCPSLCPVCQPEESTDEEKEGNTQIRLVRLGECGHEIRATLLEARLEEAERCVKLLRCPTCRAPICLTQRFRDWVLAARQAILKALTAASQPPDSQRLEEAFTSLTISPLIQDCSRLSTELKKQWQRLMKQKQQQEPAAVAGLVVKVAVVDHLLQAVTRHLGSAAVPAVAQGHRPMFQLLNQLLRWLQQQPGQLGPQQAAALAVECRRIDHALQLWALQRKLRLEPAAREPAAVALATEDDLSSRSLQQLYGRAHSLVHSSQVYLEGTGARVRAILVLLAAATGARLQETEQGWQRLLPVSLQEGSWFCCQQDHVYRGGAVGAEEQPRCPHCPASQLPRDTV